MGFQLYTIVKVFDWARSYELPGYIYELFLTADTECQLEELVFDLAMFCDKNSCSPATIMENDAGAMFQITGILNAIGAVYYKKSMDETLTDTKGLYFDMYSEVGQNLGKFLRFSVAYKE